MKHISFLFFFFLTPFHCVCQTFTDVSGTILGNQTSGFSLYGNGVSFADFNNDGLDDLTFGSTNGQPIRFYFNTGAGFANVTLQIPPLLCDSKQVLWVDYDNDGDKDLFVSCNLEPNRLFQNNGNLTFTDITPSSGLAMENDPTFGAAFGDYNNDGWLDLYFVNLGWGGSLTSHCNHLYQNNQNGGFIDATWTTNTPDSLKAPFCASFFDYDKDGFQDIYISQDRYVYDNTMLRNTGTGSFLDESVSTGTNIYVSAMNVGVGDYDNDADLDIYITNENQPPFNVLLTNNGNSTFSNTASIAGVELNSCSWAANFADFNNDLHLDLWISSENALNQDALFMNNGNLTFNLSNFPNSPHGNYSNAIGDHNNDGLQDVAIAGYGLSPHKLWENTSAAGNNWIKVKLEGTVSNRDGVGSWIESYIGGNKYVRYTHCGEGYLNQNSLTQTIGIGSATSIDTLKIIWLSGMVDTYYDVLAGQTFLVQEGNTTVALPIDLIEFKASPSYLTIDLSWKSENEVNFSHYDLERSSEGDIFSTIQRIEGRGTGITGESVYQHEDQAVLPGQRYYYRLKMVEENGLFTYSEIISAQLKNESTGDFEIFPNPYHSKSSIISILSNSAIHGKLEVFSIEGKRLFSINELKLNSGMNEIDLPGKLTPGIYLFILQTPAQPSISKRLVVY